MNRFIFGLCLMLVGLDTARADRLILDDGSVLNGTIVLVAGEMVEFETMFAGTLQVRRDHITGMISERPLLVLLQSGDRLRATLGWDEARGQWLDSELVGVIVLADREIAAVGDPEDESMLAVAAADEVQAQIQALEQRHAEELEAAVEQAQPSAKAVWSGEISIAISGSDGNTEEFTALPRFAARRETEFDRLALGLQGRFASQDGEETENEVIGTASLERDFTERWFARGALRLERDEFEDLDLRANIDLGAGYWVIRKDHHEFKPRAGLGLQVEAFDEAENEEDVVAVLGWDYRIDLSERWRLTHVLDYRPTFSDFTGSYRLDSELAMVTMVNDTVPWGLRLQLRNEFNADPVPGVDKLDTVYSIGIERAFR